MDSRNEGATEPGMVEVVPVQSPSENFLVTEHLQRMPALAARGLLYLIVSLLAVALTYAALSRIDVVVEAQALAQPASRTFRVLTDRDGYAEAIFVKEGDRVERNTPLFRIRSRESATHRLRASELKGSIPLKKQYYDSKIASVRRELATLEKEHQRTLSIKKLKLEENALSLRALEPELAYWQREGDDLTQELAELRPLYAKKLVSQAEYNGTKSRVDNARTQKEKLLSQKGIISNSKGILEEEIAVENLGFRNKKQSLESEIRNLELEKATTIRSMGSEMERSESMLSVSAGSEEKERGTVIRAERAGIVSELFYRTPGEYIRNSDLLCTIVPSGEETYMEVTVANKDIGFIEAGTEVRYKFAAFPYTDYGTLRGKVVMVAPSAVETANHDFVYRLRGTLEKPYFEIKGKRYPVKAGMVATAELVTERKTLLTMLVQKLKK